MTSHLNELDLLVEGVDDIERLEAGIDDGKILAAQNAPQPEVPPQVRARDPWYYRGFNESYQREVRKARQRERRDSLLMVA